MDPSSDNALFYFEFDVDRKDLDFRRHTIGDQFFRVLPVVLLGVMAWDRIARNRVDWSFMLAGCLTIYLALYDFPFAMLLLAVVGRLQLQIAIDDDAIAVRSVTARWSQRPHNALFSWDEKLASANATETDRIFELRWTYGAIIIPKREFTSASQMNAFRQFVAEKLGDRCHFSQSTGMSSV